MIETEDELLTACALRFKGYEYQKEQKGTNSEINLEKSLNSFLETDRWNLTDFEKLTIFFILQRSLFKWGLEREPKDGKYWKAFRSLFFECVDKDIPNEYRDEEYFQEWQEMYLGQEQEVKNFIKGINDTTNYLM